MVVITGASGLLGTALVKYFLGRGISVKALYRKTAPNPGDNIDWAKSDLGDVNELTQIFSGADAVIHAGALVSFARRHKEKMFQINVNGTANVVNACLRADVKRIVHISSVAALGKSPNESMVNEQSPWPGASEPSAYGLTKYLAELEIFRGEAEGLSVAIVNPSVILSPINQERSSGLIFKYLRRGGIFYTDGHINFVDARDVAEAVFRLYENPSLPGRYILNGGTLPWKIFFEEVSKRLGRKPPFIKVPDSVTLIAAGLEWIRSVVLRTDPIITRETANLARQYVSYSNKKAVTELAMIFREGKDTFDWCCQ